MPKIETLEHDIAQLLTEEKGIVLPADVFAKFGTEVAMAMSRQLEKASGPSRESGIIRASEVGAIDTCPRKFWYMLNTPDAGEGFNYNTRIKFMYGDIIEEVVLTLAKAAGHDVQMEQAPFEKGLRWRGWKIKGHIDAVIDGVLVDVKSTTSYGMKDFLAGRGGLKFGYRAQLNVYADMAGIADKGWIPVDKQSGKLAYVTEYATYDVASLYADAERIIATAKVETLSPRLDTVTDGGNKKLSTECSYCQFKNSCWADANGGKGLRAFAYSTGPVYFTEVKKEPRVPEIKL